MKFEQALETMLPSARPSRRRQPNSRRRRRAGGRCRRRRRWRRQPEVPPGLEELDHGAVVIAAITSCTNTSNPSVMIGAGLLARNAVERGLTVKPWVKTSLAPGSLRSSPNTSARPGCSSISPSSASTSSATAARPASATAARCRTRCRKVVKDKNLVVASVLSGNRNFEGRIQPQVRANYLASPPLVVAYALAGRMQVDLTTEPLGNGQRRQAGVPQGHLAERAGDPGDDAAAR